MDASKICRKCDEDNSVDEDERISVKYHLSHRPGGSCQNDKSLSIIMDQGSNNYYVRKPQLSWISIIAGVGGIWSVLTGVSIISIVEILYWICNTFYNHHEAVSDKNDSESYKSYQETFSVDEKEDNDLKSLDEKNQDLILYDLQNESELSSLESG